MRIRFMGTGAADFSPLLKGQFKNRLGKSIRRSSSILIEDRYLVDCGPHVLDSFRIQQVDCSKVTYLFVTHFHSDHFNLENVKRLAKACSQPLRIWYHAGGEMESIPNTEFHPLQPGQEFQTDMLSGVALAANHTDWPLHYDMEVNGVRLFYGCDGAWLLNDTFYSMRQRNYNCMILDATVGDYVGDYRLAEHNSIPMVRLMVASFQKEHVIAPQGAIYLSHIARTLHEPHEQLAKKMKRENLIVAYDGLVIEIL